MTIGYDCDSLSSTMVQACDLLGVTGGQAGPSFWVFGSVDGDTSYLHHRTTTNGTESLKIRLVGRWNQFEACCMLDDVWIPRRGSWIRRFGDCRSDILA